MLEVGPLLEQVRCDLMRFWRHLGNRAVVVNQYRTLTELLVGELGTDPMPGTLVLYTELASGVARKLRSNKQMRFASVGTGSKRPWLE
jgi:DNA-binding SARP family transcriptional activator